MIVKILIGAVLIIIIANLLLRNRRKNFIKELKFGHIGDSIEQIKNTFKKYEVISNIVDIDNTKYLIVKTQIKKTIKIFEFKDEICTGFYIQSIEVAYSLPDNFDYDAEFHRIEGLGPSTSNYLADGLFVKINEKYGKLFKYFSPNLNNQIIWIYILNQTNKGLERFIEIIKTDLDDELLDFNIDK